MNLVSTSVVIVTKNRHELLQRAVKSVLDQTVKPEELIVVDDGSDEKVRLSGEDIDRENINFQLIRNENSVGPAAARNIAIKAATCSLVAFLDDDDEFMIEKLEKVQKVFVKDPLCDVVYHLAEIHMVNEGVSYQTKQNKFNNNEHVFRSLLVANRIGGAPVVVVKRKCLISNESLFDERLPALEDYDLWLRLAHQDRKFTLLNESLTKCYYYTRKTSVSKNIAANLAAIDMISNKYVSSYKSLDDLEVTQLECWIKKMLVHKSLLNGNKSLALKYQLQLIKLAPSVINLGALFAILLGPRFVFTLKAKVGI